MQTSLIKKLSPTEARERAQLNIIKKIAILGDWLRDGIPLERDSKGRILCDDTGCQILVYAPNSLRSFNTWTKQLYSDETQIRLAYLTSIHRNGTDTLNKYPFLKDQAVSLIQDLGRILKQHRYGSDRTTPTAELEIKSLRLFIQNQNKKIIQFHKENINLSRSVSTIEMREKSRFDELKLNYMNLDKQNIQLREKISLLTKQLNNIYSLRDVNNES